MNMTGIVYRPPYEANSLLLQVTLGCSHNKCTFCYMYPDVQFKVCPMEEVEADIEEATRYCPNVKRVFLEHGDAFVLSAEKLLKIADAIHRKLPKVETIAMYASIQNIKTKTDEELQLLRAAGIHGLDIGVESGLDAALTYMNKGQTSAEAREQLLRLTKAGMDYSFNAQPGCRLYQDMKSGTFKECNIGQLLDEQERLIRRLDLKDTYYFGSHPSNLVPMQAKLPDQKQDMLEAVQETREQLRAHLDEVPVRGGEGSILNR